MKRIIFSLWFIVYGLFVYAQDETLTLLTYYPAPYGIYQNLNVMGNVGIGTTVPGAKLTVASTGGTGFEDTDGSAEVHIGTQMAAANTAGEKYRLALQPYGHTGGPYNIVNRDTSDAAFLDVRYGTGGTLFTIKHDGKVGIGTNDPQAPLDINGLMLEHNGTDGLITTDMGNIQLDSEGDYIDIPNDDILVAPEGIIIQGKGGTNFLYEVNFQLGTWMGGITWVPRRARQILTAGDNWIAFYAKNNEGNAKIVSTNDIRLVPRGSWNDLLGTVTEDTVNGKVYIAGALDVSGGIYAVLPNIEDGASGNYDMDYDLSLRKIGYDIAELFEANHEVEPGDVLVIDENGKLKNCDKPNDSKIAGIVSNAPAILFEGSELQIAPQPFKFQNGNKPPLAIAGRVFCKVTAENGPVEPGDLLTTSSTPGHAMKAKPVGEINGYPIYPQGCIIGKALEPLKEGKGKILVLVCLM